MVGTLVAVTGGLGAGTALALLRHLALTPRQAVEVAAYLVLAVTVLALGLLYG